MSAPTPDSPEVPISVHCQTIPYAHPDDLITPIAPSPSRSALNQSILLCVDVCEENAEPWSTAEPFGPTRLAVIKQTLAAFVRRKASADRRHRFGVCLLGDSTLVHLPFTSELQLVLATIDSLSVVKCQQRFDFDGFFDTIGDELPLETPPLPGAEATTLFRALLVFGRSHAVPHISVRPSLLDHPRFFLDALYVHKKMGEEGVVCQDTYDFFMDQLDAECGKTAYIFEVAASLPRLHQHAMMLLAHPAQRDDQDSFLEKLEHVPAEGD